MKSGPPKRFVIRRPCSSRSESPRHLAFDGRGSAIKAGASTQRPCLERWDLDQLVRGRGELHDPLHQLSAPVRSRRCPSRSRRGEL